MTSKYRVTVNFSKVTYDAIDFLSEASNMSKSKIIERIVSENIDKHKLNNDDNLIEYKPLKENILSNNVNNFDKFIFEKRKSNNDRNEGPKTFYYSGFYDKEFDININTTWPENHSAIKDVVIELFKKEVIENPMRMLHRNLSDSLSSNIECIEYLLIICHEAIVSKKEIKYHEEKKEVIRVKLKLSNHPITRSMLASYNFRHLDFFNIKYYSFYDIACNGWSGKDHYRMIHIGPRRIKASGSYFLGVSYNEIDYETKDRDELTLTYNDEKNEAKTRGERSEQLIWISLDYTSPPQQRAQTKIIFDKRVIKIKI